MYPVAPICSIRSLSFISILVLSLSVIISQESRGVTVWQIEFLGLRLNQELLLVILILILIVIELPHH